MLRSFLQPNIEIEGLVGKAESVAIKRLDDVLDEVIQDQSAARVFLKMDTQGLTPKLSSSGFWSCDPLALKERSPLRLNNAVYPVLSVV